MSLKKLKAENIRHLVVHCAATPPSSDIGVEAIDRWHRERGWRKVGYHYVITRDGLVQFGRCADEMGAHVKGRNDTSIGICLVGGVDEEGEPEDNYTPNQQVSLRALLEALQYAYPEAEVVGHRDFPEVDKACPCFDVQEWYTNG